MLLLLTHVPLKRCDTCKLLVAPKRYRKNASKKDGLSSTCSPCNAKLRKLRAIKHRLLAKSLRQAGCIYCGELDSGLLDFHHVNPMTKSGKIADMYRATGKKFKAELAKCEVVCAGCHRKIEQGYILVKLCSTLNKLSCLRVDY